MRLLALMGWIWYSHAPPRPTPNRLLQVTLTAACLGALTGGGRVHLPGGGYSSTTAYRLLVAAAALGLATAAVLGVWQALRALSFGFYRFARRGTRVRAPGECCSHAPS